MSDISISADTLSSMALNDQASGVEGGRETGMVIASGANSDGSEAMDQAVVGAEVVSRSQDYIGTGPDYTSTGTDVDIQSAVQSAIMSGTGTITDKIV